MMRPVLILLDLPVLLHPAATDWAARKFERQHSQLHQSLLRRTKVEVASFVLADTSGVIIAILSVISSVHHNLANFETRDGQQVKRKMRKG